MSSILITGAEGMIGREVYQYFIDKYSSKYTIHRIDKSKNLDLCDGEAVAHWMLKFKPEYIIHLASLTDVAESILLPAVYLRNNLANTLNLLESVRLYNPTARVLLFNTDEVYDYRVGEYVNENSPVNPRNPYSASKMAQKAMGLAYKNTYNLDIVITHMTNCIGPHQSEITHIGNSKKLVPALFEAAVNHTPFKMDDGGKAVRTWIDVRDAATAIDTILFNGTETTYNIAGNETRSVREIYDMVSEITGANIEVINTNRQGQDYWYALDTSRLAALGWKPKHRVRDTLEELWQNNNW